MEQFLFRHLPLYDVRDAIDAVDDDEQRKRLEEAYEDFLANRTKFGLVYEHNPECRNLWGLPIRVGDNVRCANPLENQEEMTVTRTGNGNFEAEGQDEHHYIVDYVRFAEPGEVTFPTLENIDSQDPDAPILHRLIEGDNLDALHLMTFDESNSYDVIYIDPPYGSGSTEYTYNNRFVNPGDNYAPSMWLSMMHSRLHMAKKLIKEDGVLIIAIDDFNVHRLRMLLDQGWRGWRHHVIAVRHNASGGLSKGIVRTHEYCLVLTKGNLDGSERDFRFQYEYEKMSLDWEGGFFRRGDGDSNHRRGAANQFFAILVDDTNVDEDGKLAVVGAEQALGPEDEFEQYSRNKDNFIRVFPVSNRPPHHERPWRYVSDSINEIVERGIAASAEEALEWRRSDDVVVYGLCCNRSGTEGNYTYVIHQLKLNGVTERVRSMWGEHQNRDGVQRAHGPPSRYNAGTHGTDMLKDIIGENEVFSYSKSLYTVGDIIEAATLNIPNAKILDFFAGSGTTCRATMLMNEIHGGNRQCTIVTNNEMLKETIKNLWQEGVRPESTEWEGEGNARKYTFPSCRNVILGTNNDGGPIDGTYLYGGNREISEGFEGQGVVHQRIRFIERTEINRGKFLFDEMNLLSAPRCSTRIINNASDLRVLEEELGGGEADITQVFVNSYDREFCNLVSVRLSSLRVKSLREYRDHFSAHPIPAHTGGIKR